MVSLAFLRSLLHSFFLLYLIVYSHLLFADSAPVQSHKKMGAEDDNKSDTKSTDTDLNTPISCIRCNRPSCKRLVFTFNNYWQLAAMSVTVVIYSLIGAVIFNAIERPNELRQLEESKQASEDAISQFVYMLTNTTNLTEEEARNTTDLLLQIGRAAAEAEANITRANNPIWDYSSSLFFVSTVITTIGEL